MKMKELGLLFMMLCMVFAVNAQELKKGDKLPDFHLKSAVYGDISSTEAYLPLGAGHVSWNWLK